MRSTLSLFAAAVLLVSLLPVCLADTNLSAGSQCGNTDTCVSGYSCLDNTCVQTSGDTSISVGFGNLCDANDCCNSGLACHDALEPGSQGRCGPNSDLAGTSPLIACASGDSGSATPTAGEVVSNATTIANSTATNANATGTDIANNATGIATGIINNATNALNETLGNANSTVGNIIGNATNGAQVTHNDDGTTTIVTKNPDGSLTTTVLAPNSTQVVSTSTSDAPAQGGSVTQNPGSEPIVIASDPNTDNGNGAAGVPSPFTSFGALVVLAVASALATIVV